MLRRFNQDQIFTASILLIGALIVAFSGALARFDYVFYDASRVFSYKKAPEDIVIVAIDERSLDAIGKWPWPRKIHAALLKIISQGNPKAMGVDIFFSEPDSAHPEDDQALAQVLLNAPNLVLPMVIDAPFQGARLVQNQSMPLLKAAEIGRVNVPLDVDGIARGVYLWEAVSQDGKAVLGLPLFSFAILKTAGQLPVQLNQPPPLLALADKNGLQSNVISTAQLFKNSNLVQQSKIVQQSNIIRLLDKKIHFYGPPNHFKQVSYSSVLSGEVPAEYFKNKIVLVGATAVGMGDVLATPVSGFSKPMSGVEFHANALETIRQNQLISVASIGLTCLINVFLAMLPVLWLPRLKPLKSLLIISLYLITIILLTMLMPILIGLWMPTSAAILMILLAYPIWSWRRLERAHTFLNAELKQLNQDLNQFGLPTLEAETTQKPLMPDVLQSRIAQLKHTSQLLRALHKNRNDTLSFISHDIRLPIATALMLLKEGDISEQKLKVVTMLDRANKLADNFLQVSKLAAISPSTFKELELNGLMQEVVDHLYTISQAKQINIQLDLHESALWVNGEFSLLQRAFENIVDNAVKYSPADTCVKVILTKENAYAIVRVIDQGAGISAEKIPQLFLQFNRLEQTASAARGAGLGLYFVEMTIKKHGGEVKVNSVLGQSSTFIIALPCIL